MFLTRRSGGWSPAKERQKQIELHKIGVVVYVHRMHGLSVVYADS